jgi:hypothetical protein
MRVFYFGFGFTKDTMEVVPRRAFDRRKLETISSMAVRGAFISQEHTRPLGQVNGWHGVETIFQSLA